MVIFLAIVGALLLGLLVGLSYKGLVLIGDRRQLGVITEQLRAEDRLHRSTTEAIALMRAVVREQLRR